MKTISRLSVCVVTALCLTAFTIHAAPRSERLLTLTLTGFDQFVNQTTGNDVAVPFRATTKDFLFQITDATGTNVDGGVLVVIDSLDETNGLTKIVARTKVIEVDVTDFFPISQGDFVQTTKFVGNELRSATFYAIDQFQFSSVTEAPGDTNGIDLILQGFTKETQRVGNRKIGGVLRSVTSSALRSDGNGELLDYVSTNRFLSPFKGTVTIGAPKFFP